MRSSENIIVMLKLARFKAGTKEEYWLATGELPKDYPVRMEDFSRMFVKWAPEENGDVHPKTDWAASILPPWKEGQSTAEFSLKLRNPVSEDEEEMMMMKKSKIPCLPIFWNATTIRLGKKSMLILSYQLIIEQFSSSKTTIKTSRRNNWLLRY